MRNHFGVLFRTVRLQEELYSHLKLGWIKVRFGNSTLNSETTLQKLNVEFRFFFCRIHKLFVVFRNYSYLVVFRNYLPHLEPSPDGSTVQQLRFGKCGSASVQQLRSRVRTHLGFVQGLFRVGLGFVEGLFRVYLGWLFRVYLGSFQLLWSQFPNTTRQFLDSAALGTCCH